MHYKVTSQATTYASKINEYVNHLGIDVLSALDNCASIKVYKKGDFLLRQGRICTHSFQIKRGFARKFYLNNGKEITTELFFKDDIAISLSSYIMQQPGKEFIQAITDVEVSVMDYASFQEAKKIYPDLAILDGMIGDYYSIWLEERLFQFHTMTAKERYHLLLTTQPEIIQHIPLTHIASYLGISLETLSRIRARI